MKKYFLTLLTISLFFILGFKGQDSQPKNRINNSKSKMENIDAKIVPNTLIIKMKVDPKNALFKGDALNKFNAILDNCKMVSFEKIFPHKKELSKTSAESIDLSKFYILKYSEDISPYELIKIFSKNEMVEYAEPKYISKLMHSPNDYHFVQGNQWGLKKIEAEKAWDISRGNKAVIIAIVDTGVDWLHEDLADNIWINTKEIPGNGIDDDNNGYIDDVRGWDFGGLGNVSGPTPDNDPNEDRPDHGTHVAGIASGVTNNGIGIAGVGYNCLIMAVKSSQDNQRNVNGLPYVLFGYESIVYAADNGADVINCSWGGGGYSRFEEEIIQYANQKGVVIVAAAGNENSFRSNYCPASYDHVIAVAATDENDRRLISNWGYYVDVSAPGSNIYSTWKGNNYINQLGTSVAAPHVAGVAGLVKATYPNYTSDQIAEQIRVSADNIDALNPSYKGMLGFGRLNAYRALTISSPAVRIISKKLEDSNGNGVFEVGEQVKLMVTIKNYLDPAHNLDISLSSTSGYINVKQGNFSLSNLGTLDEASNVAVPFEFEIDQNAPMNEDAYLIVTYKADGYEDQEGFGIILNPSYLNTTVSKINMTVTSEGNIGFRDFPNNRQGIGFIYDGGSNLLFEGSLILAESVYRISDAARNNGNYKNNIFQTITPIRYIDDDFFDEICETTFNDARNSIPIGIQTTLNTYAFKNEPYDNFVILKYTYKNTNASKTVNLSSGLFFDWDLSFQGANDIVKYDPSTLMGYVYDNTNQSQTYVGVALLSVYKRVNFCPIFNPGDSPWGIYDGFSNAEKYQSMNSGINKESAGPGDISFVIGPGPILLDAGEDTASYYVMVAGNSLDELREAVGYAKQKLSAIGIDTSIPPPGDYPFLNTTVSKINMTVTNDGNIGFCDFPQNGEGIGFIYNESRNLLLEGSLMLATSESQVSDVARNNTGKEQNRGFQTLTPICYIDDDFSDETCEITFNDARASNPIGIQTTLNTYAFKNEPYNSFVILKYTYKNTNDSGVVNLSSGLFFDWNLGLYSFLDETVKYDPSTLMGYVYNNTNQPQTYVGVALLSVYDRVNFWPKLDFNYFEWGVHDGFFNYEKYQSMTSGVNRDSVGPGDISFVIGPGLVSLGAREESTSYYVIVAGNSLDELREAVGYAKQKLSTIDVASPIPVPSEYALLGNYPNPFNPSTNIKFSLKEKSNIRIYIYDVKGSVVSVIDRKDMPAGENNILVNMGNRATGAYYYKFSVFNDQNKKVFEKSSRFMMIR